MADKLTLLELHLHAEDNEFTSDMELSSDVGGIVRDRLGLGDEDEQSTFGETDFGESSDSEASADGGNTVQVGESDEDDEDHGAVVEIDEAADEDEPSDSGGRSKTKALFMLVLLVGFTLLARHYLGDDDEFEDEFEEL